MFRFGFDGFLYAYVLVPLFGVFFWYAFRARRRAMLRFGNARQLQGCRHHVLQINRRGVSMVGWNIRANDEEGYSDTVIIHVLFAK